MNYKNIFFCIVSVIFVGNVQPTFAMVTKKQDNKFLFEACEEGYPVKKIAAFIKRSTNMCLELNMVNAENEAQDKPLHIACAYGYIDIVKLLIAWGADIDSKMRGFATPLHCAVIHQHAHIVRHLLDMGADTDAKNRQGLTAFDLARRYKNQIIMELFPVQSNEEMELRYESAGDVMFLAQSR